MSTRTEADSLGTVEVPAERLWGAQTQRALENFPGGPRYRWRPSVIRALAFVKKMAALANGELRILPGEKTTLIIRACDEVLSGRCDDEFPLPIFHSGSGTQSNMNANEVISRLANLFAGGDPGSKPHVHPNDDVNRSQSSNDVFPTVMHIAAVETLHEKLLPVLTTLRETLAKKSQDFASIVMVGRTHLQDATPITLGQVIGGWIGQLHIAQAAIDGGMAGLLELPIGGTAVGTGLNADPRFGEAFCRHLAQATGHAYVCTQNRFAGLSGHESLAISSSALRVLAGALMKLANDIRWYASGPRSGLGELLIPENEPGSSIMPGKINPTQCEALTMIAAQVYGNDHTVAFAASQGNFQLNVFKPVILHNALESIELLAEGMAAFHQHCLTGLKPNLPRIREHLDSSLMLVTALNPHIGYEKAARIALAAHRENLTLREAAIRSGFVAAEDFDRWVVPENMT